MQLIVLPRKRQARQERHGKLVIIVIIITIIIISLGSSRYPSSGSDASYAWVETVKCQEATCTECKIQKGFGGKGGAWITLARFQFLPLHPSFLLFLSPFCSIFFSSNKKMFSLLALSQSFSVSATPSLILVTFICFVFHCMSFLMYLQFLSHLYTISRTHTPHPSHHVTQHHHTATRL